MNYFKPNSKTAIKLAIAIKSLTASLVLMEWVKDKPNYMFATMVIGAVANETINFFSYEKI